MTKITRLAMTAMTAFLGATIAASAESTPDTTKHSTFDERSVPRNPFLPIGWQASAPVVRNTTVLTLSPEAFKVTSIVVDHTGGLAIVNGKACGPGDVLMTQVGGREIPVRVKEVRDGEVVLFYRGKPIVSPLDEK